MLERVNMKIHAASFLKQLPILPTHFIGKIWPSLVEVFIYSLSVNLIWTSEVDLGFYFNGVKTHIWHYLWPT